MKSAVLMALMAALVGCSGGPADEPGRTSSGLSDAAPLPTLSDEAWTGADEGCEGLLDGSEDFGITQRDALVVARRGDVLVCIDTLEAVSLELEAVGALDSADDLYGGFFAAIHLSQVHEWGEETPLDALPDDGRAQGDPNPVPNGTGDGDPNPIPNSGSTDEGDENTAPGQPYVVEPMGALDATELPGI